MKALRPIMPLNLAETPRADLQAWKPAIVWVKPTQLLVDEGYQRSLTERSVKLITKIVANWNWAAFKPPVVVEVDGGLHTAIAAATHGGVAAIPCFVVQAGETIDRARAFVAHNRDRVVMTPQALHHAMVAAGDEDAVTVEQVCARAGVKILRQPPWNGRYEVGETSALGAIRQLVRGRGAMNARKALDVCVAARLAPVSADFIKAVDLLMFGKDYAESFDADKTAAAILRDPGKALAEATQLGAAKNWPKWKALAVVLSRKARARVAAGSDAA